MANWTKPLIPAVLITLALALLLLTTSCGGPPPVKVRIGVFPGEQSAPMAVAEEKGYFRENGLEVETVAYESGAAAVEALLAGELDAATATEYVFAVRSFDAPELMLLFSMDCFESTRFIAAKGSGMSETADIAGRRVGVPGGTAAEYLLGTSLARAGLTLGEVTVVNLPPGELGGALQRGEVDAVVVWQPIAYEIEKAMGGNAVAWSAHGLLHSHWTLLSTEAALEKKPGMSGRLARAAISAVQFIRDEPDRAKEAVGEAFGLSASYLEEAWPGNLFRVVISQQLVSALEREGRWYRESGLSEKVGIPNYLERIDFAGMESADPDAVKIAR